MHAVAARGRWIWAVSGLATMVVLALPTVRLITHTGEGWGTYAHAYPQATMTRTLSVSQPVTSVTVDTSGPPVQVTSGRVSQVQITEKIWYDKQAGEPGTVTPTVSRDNLALTDSACDDNDCSVEFSLVVPPGLAATVSSEGGDVIVSGTAATVVDSGGGAVAATGISGRLNVTAEGGPVRIDGLTGMLSADTGGGPLIARDLTATATDITAQGGDVTLAFAAPPDSVKMDTGGGAATLMVPRGPYALTADTGGGEESLEAAIDPAAPRSIAISTEGGPLLIRSPVSGAARAQKAAPPQKAP